MSEQPATQSSKQLGGTLGTRRDWRGRLLFHHVPLALASALVLVLFMTLPLFDAKACPHVDIFSGAPPQQRGEGRPTGGPMQHGQDQTGPMQHGREQTSGSVEVRSDSSLGLNIRGFTVGTGYVATGSSRSRSLSGR